MSATHLSFDDWREAVRTDQRDRIERLNEAAVGNDPHGLVGEYLSEARDAWYSNPSEAERFIKLAEGQFKQEREWESERIAKTAAHRGSCP
jgi:hypothetical protein